jgi:hypothetical protein
MKSLLTLALCLTAAGATLAQPRIAVTDLAYTQEVAEYFEVATIKQSGGVHANQNTLTATHQASGTYVAGTYSYLEQRELGSFTNDIKGALLKGTSFRLVQGKLFDAGAPQPTKAEQVLNQVKTGKVATPVRQPQVHDIIARIKKGEFNSADYVLFGTLTSLQFRDTLSPIQGTSNASYIYSLDLVADFSLISTKTYEIKAAFSAQGAGSETKLLSTRGDILPPNRGKVIRETSQTLAANVFEQFSEQIALAEGGVSRQLRPVGSARQDASSPVVPPAKTESVTTLR